MLDKETIYRALRTGDTRKVRRALNSEPPSLDNARILLSAIKQTGCLIDRFGSKGQPRIREAIVKIAEGYLAADGSCLQLFNQHLADSLVLNAIFSRIKSIVSSLPVSAISPAQQAWSVIDWAVLHLSTLHKRALNPRGEEPLLIRPGVATSTSNDGTPVDIDAMMGAVEQYVRMTLSMLAFENAWWDQDGKLCLPSRGASEEEHVRQAGAHIDLASIWDLVVSASESLRFWGRKIDLTEVETGTGPGETFRVFVFDLDIDGRLDFLISQMRVIQLEFDFHMTQMGLALPPFKNPEDAPVPMPPISYVSADELLTTVLLSTLYHYELDVPDTTDRLCPEKLIRGYAVLKLFFERPFDKAEFTVIPFDQKRIVSALQNASLSSEEASTFLEFITFGRDSRDLFDCPLIRAESGEIFIFQGFVQFLGLSRAIVSRLNSLSVDFNTKGSAFEREVRDLLLEHGLPAREIKFNIGSEQYQFDAVFPWGEFVFLFECKNYLLPSDSPAQEFHFNEKMSEAVDQVLRLKTALEDNAVELKRAFPESEGAKTIIPVVLNAMPFSMNRQERSVFVYDYSALSRFFVGHISAKQPIYMEGKLIQVEHLVRSLWSPHPQMMNLVHDEKVGGCLIAIHALKRP